MSEREKILSFFITDKAQIPIKTLAEALGYEVFRFNAYLRKGGDADLKLLYGIYAISGVAPATMGIDRILDVSNNPNILNPGEEPPTYLSFSQWKKDRIATEFSVYYFESIISKLKEAKNEVIVYDYFLNNPFDLTERDITRYFDGYENYYKTVEALHKNKNFIYTRIIALPLHLQSILTHLNLDPKDYLIASIFLLFKESFDHIIRSYQLFGDRFKLYITDRPSRSYSIMIQDEEYVYSEYYRIKQSRKILVPDILYIDKAIKGNSYEGKLKLYKEEFLSLNKDRISETQFRLMHEKGLEIVESGIRDLGKADSLIANQKKEGLGSLRHKVDSRLRQLKKGKRSNRR